MVDISTISTAIELTKRLRVISKKVQDAEFTNVLADLSMALAESKMSIADLLQQNADLKNEIRELRSAEFDACPKCREGNWKIISSAPDKDFGDMGGIRREMACDACGFTEGVFVNPG